MEALIDGDQIQSDQRDHNSDPKTFLWFHAPEKSSDRDQNDVEGINKEIKSLSFIADYEYISAYQQENSDIISYTIHVTINNNETLTKENIDMFINNIVNIIKKHNGEVKGF